MNFQQILSDLKNRNYRPVYLLHGEESYFIDNITDYLARTVLKEEEKTFNQTIFYGRDTEAVNVINTARRFPMMSEYQVVLLKEAQEMKDLEQLHVYTEQPLRSTILLIAYKYKSFDKRKKLYRSIEKNGIIFESKKLYDDKVPAWITAWLKQKGIQTDIKSAVLLTEYLGNDLSRIVNELEKLILGLPEGEKTIRPALIEQNIGISKDYNNFELQKSLIQKNSLKANRIIRYFADNPKQNPITLTIASLYFFFSKVLHYHSIKDQKTPDFAAKLGVNPYFIKDYEAASRKYSPRSVIRIIGLLREYDLKSKGYGSLNLNQGELLKELIYKILH